MRPDQTTVVCVDLSSPLCDRDGLEGCADALVVLTLHGEPVATTRVPVAGGRLRADVLARRIVDDHAAPVAAALARRASIDRDGAGRPDVTALLTTAPPPLRECPAITVAVCTRERPDDLDRCLDGLERLDYPNLDLLVVDNAPRTDATERVVRRHPRMRYVREPRPGLDWARNRAIIECRGEILAYTDDDVIVDRGWATALARMFAADPGVMAVTGLVLPHELATDAQRLFETYGGFGRGFLRRWIRAAAGRPVAAEHGGTGKLGTGANMAFRRELFDRIGGFDPALDVGTCTNGGGDLEMFFRVLKHGHTLVYEPAAIVRHRHRRDMTSLRSQIANNGIGFYSFLVRSALVYRDERRAVARLAVWWFCWWSLRRLARALARKEQIPLELITGELVGSLRGLRRYQRARQEAARTAAAHRAEPQFLPASIAAPPGTPRLAEAVRRLDLAEPLAAIDDVSAYERVRVFVSWRGRPAGAVRIEHHGAVINPLWLGDAIAQQLSGQLLAIRAGIGVPALWSCLVAGLVDRVSAATPAASLPAPPAAHATVSVVVATFDRPNDLAACLASLAAQRTSRRVEIIVVDNHPVSGVTPAVVSRFPAVRLIEEARGGLSYARNAGILAATGDIIATTDDDAVCGPEWVERLAAPFEEDHVMAVTGNVLPAELETDAQRMFEAYGGLGRGYARLAVDRAWFRGRRRAVPTWELGCTASAAFRASIFSDPAIGLLDEALGAGTPTGCSEDTYLFYRILKAGFAIVYEAEAVVWHTHRRTMRELRRQIYSYSKGHVAYQLTTWLNDGDRRALLRLGVELPLTYLRRAGERLRGRSDYPLHLIALEVLGNIAGPWALWTSRRRVRQLGRSAPGPQREVETTCAA